MLYNLCFVSVKKVEKWVSWLLVSVEMAPSEIVLEDNSLAWHSKKIWFPGHDNLRSRATPTPIPASPPQLNTTISTNIQTQACRQTHTYTHTYRRTITRTRWPVLLRRREMLSNSAFQHSTSDYLFSFTGRFELVMYFPFSAFLPFSLALIHAGNSSFASARAPLGQKLKRSGLFPHEYILCCLTETL